MEEDSFVRTYNQSFIESHTDSSDFDTPKPSQYDNANRKLRKIRPKKEKDFINQQISNNILKHSNYDDTNIPVHTNSMKKTKYLWRPTATTNILNQFCEELNLVTNNTPNTAKGNKNKGGRNSELDVKASPSKWCILKQKVMPRLSYIFGRSVSGIKQGPIDEENAIQTNNSQMHSFDYERIQKRDKIRQEVLPIYYSIEGNIQLPVHVGPTKIIQVPLIKKRQTIRKQKSNHSLSSSSDIVAKKRKKFQQRMIKLIRKEYLKQLLEKDFVKKRAESRAQQYPSKQYPYQIFVAPSSSHYRNKNATISELYSDLTSSSAIWDSIFENVTNNNNKETYQTRPTEICISDHCALCYELGVQADSARCCRNCTSMSDNLNVKISQPPQITKKDKKKKKDKKDKIPHAIPQQPCQCRCNQKIHAQKPTSSAHRDFIPPVSLSAQELQYDTSADPSESRTDCRQPHDDVKKLIESNYNGEVLCIHNPPCILINGCVNIPTPSTPQKPIHVYSASKIRSGFICRKKKGQKNKKCEQASQYEQSTLEAQQCQTSDYRTDKEMQSLCCHQPPCKEIRVCVKSKYQPVLENSCIHIPMCHKYKCPDHADKNTQNSFVDQSCKYKGKLKSTDLFIVNKDYLMNRDRPNISVQAKPDHDSKCENYCVHVPMCQKLPECFIEGSNQNELFDEFSECRHNYSEVPVRSMDYTKFIGAQAESGFDQGSDNLRVYMPRCQRLPKRVAQNDVHNGSLQQPSRHILTPRDTQTTSMHDTTVPAREDISTQAKNSMVTENYCEHIPLCQKLPECIVNDNNRNKCRHKPKCREVPTCKSNFIVLTAKDVYTGMRSRNTACGHNPPCVMRPICLEEHGNAPGDCKHQPGCDKVPACCKKYNNKGMVSVSSQYPASCRIV